MKTDKEKFLENTICNRKESIMYDDNFIKKKSFDLNSQNLLGSQFLYDKENDFLRTLTFFDKEGNGVEYQYYNNELLSKTSIKVQENQIIKNGKFEKYEKGIPVKISGYLNGRLHGENIELDLKTNKIKRKIYSNGEDISGQFLISEKLNKLGEATIDIFLEKNPEIVLKKIFKEILKQNKKNEKVPNIKVDFENSHLEFGKDTLGYTSFYKDGSPKIISEKATLSENEEIIFKGNFLEHYDNCKLKSKGKNNEKGEKTDKWQFFNEDGSLFAEKNYNKTIELDNLSKKEIKEHLVKNPLFYRYLNDSQKRDKDIVITSLKNDAFVLEFVPKDMLQDIEIKQIIKENKNILNFIDLSKNKSSKIEVNNKEISKKKCYINKKIKSKNENER